MCARTMCACATSNTHLFVTSGRHYNLERSYTATASSMRRDEKVDPYP